MPRRPARARKPDADLPILQLRVRLLDVSPMVWRRLLVPVRTTLQELHGILQVASKRVLTTRPAGRGFMKYSAGQRSAEVCGGGIGSGGFLAAARRGVAAKRNVAGRLCRGARDWPVGAGALVAPTGGFGWGERSGS